MPADDKIKLKESRKRVKYLDLAREKIWYMRETMIPVVVDTF